VRAGFDVVPCAGGRDGIAQVQSRHADLVMVDLRMPDVGGLEVLRAIRESNPNCQAVLMTGYAAVDTAVEAIKLGAMDYLSKPLDFTRLQQMLGDVRDEIGELPLTVQAKLLRVLELGEVHRVGSLDARKVNVHVIAATNRDLRAEVAAGRFRSDLYYRLNIVEVKLPALRERREDIPYLTAAFVRETAERLGKPLVGLTPGAERVLGAAPWDGNVRELRNAIERACILADGEFVTERELAVSMPTHAAHPAAETAAPAAPRSEADADLLVNVEREHIQRALVRANGNKKAAARMLGLSRRALYRRLERLDLGETISRRRDVSADAIGV
jgi:DNA-binding NtrC family response regulator